MDRQGLITTVVLYFLTFLGVFYIVYPRVAPYPLLTAVIAVVFLLFFAAYLFGIISIFSGALLTRLVFARFYQAYVFPLASFYAGLFVRDPVKRWEKFIRLNNAVVARTKYRLAPDEVIVLLPHCLQNTRCQVRITTDIRNCEQCGICEIGEIRDILDEFGVRGYVVTGGTLARRIAREKRPRGIIAVACHHDLSEGIELVYPMPVYGVLNDRPEGPCVNTRVNTDEIRHGLTVFLESQGR